MTIDPENKSLDNLARVAKAAQEAGIADESAAYETAVEASGTATDPDTSNRRDDARTNHASTAGSGGG